MGEDSKKRIETMKKNYRQMPVPPEAKSRMEAGIAKAKKEKRRGKIMKIGRNIGIGAVAAMLAITIMANATPTTANAMEGIPVIGAIAKVVTFRTFENKTKNFEADIKVPQVSIAGQDESKANKSIEDYANQLIKQYQDELAASQGEGHYALTSSYKVVTDDSKYLSLRIDTTLAMGDGTQFVKIFTINKATGQVVAMKDLFKDKPDYKKAISDEIKRQMMAQKAADPSKVFFYGNNDGIEDPDPFDQITGDESFYFNKNGEMVITFDEDTIAPAAMGALEFTLPKSVTGDLDPASK